ncbi:hypothetical protein V5N11_022838 [Cardamine amara subsp. amara]|uniref:Uncharacterized protein n=1 Tax=Cardamine amara subsp. amara TaxID=228776 RepID=A0ABD1ASD2_CARAN
MRSGTKEDVGDSTKKVRLIRIIKGTRQKITGPALLASRERVEKAGVFDIKSSEYGLWRYVCKSWRPCPDIVSAYARLGLDRYNMLNRTKFQLVRVRKYVMTTTPVACYYITLQAIDPTSCSPRTRIFQICVGELYRHRLSVHCTVARRRGTVDTNEYSGPASKFYDVLARSLLEWPPHNPFQKSLVKEQDKDQDWIRLYLELAVATTFRSNTKINPSKLEILKVAIETMKDANEGPDADSVIVLYIRYKDLCEARVGKNVDRVAIVRRRFNKVTGWFSLEGKTLSAEIVLPKKVKSQSRRRYLFRQRLGIHKPWRLSYPRMCKVYKNLGKNQSPRVLLFKQRLGIHQPWRLSVCKALKNRGSDD